MPWHRLGSCRAIRIMTGGIPETTFLLISRAGTIYAPLPRSECVAGFDPELVIYSDSQFLFTTKVPLSCLYRNVPEQKLNLIQFAAGKMAQSCACPSEIMWREFVNARLARSIFHDFPQNLRRHAVSPDWTSFVDRSEHAAFFNLSCLSPCINGLFTQSGIGTVRMCPPLPTKSAITQCSSRN